MPLMDDVSMFLFALTPRRKRPNQNREKILLGFEIKNFACYRYVSLSTGAYNQLDIRPTCPNLNDSMNISRNQKG